jgi:hypothetical protein
MDTDTDEHNDTIHIGKIQAQKNRFSKRFFCILRMAEREGFEPSMGFNAHTPLAGERLRPLGHLSAKHGARGRSYIHHPFN